MQYAMKIQTEVLSYVNDPCKALASYSFYNSVSSSFIHLHCLYHSIFISSCFLPQRITPPFSCVYVYPLQHWWLLFLIMTAAGDLTCK